MRLTKKDIRQIEDSNISVDTITKQLETFKEGIPFTNVVTAASIGNGIEEISPENQQKLVDLYDNKKDHLDLVKFVPASGAATRMFSFLHEFLNDFDPEKENLRIYLKQEGKEELSKFLNSLKEFAFVNSVRKKIREVYPEYRHGTKGIRAYLFVSLLLGKKGLNFDNMPKGLVPFHKYSKYATTAFEEQLYEAAFYASNHDEAFLHFTFTKKHLPYFKKEFDGVVKRVHKKTKTKFNISYSFQKKGTDTIAVTEDNKPLRNGHDSLVFRPSGHGALLENLNEVDADVVFMKNIDNVVTEDYAEKIAYTKKMLAGKLLWLQQKVFNYLRVLLEEDVDDEKITEIRSFLWNALNIKNAPESIDGLIGLLNRPIRVCGVVRNTGAPGGGPFWVKNEIGNNSLQIVELAQIDVSDSHQLSIVNEATHFNPVDIVCGLRDFTGKKFDLTDFTDPDSGFIAKKTHNGKTIKALELPGLWNGSMANWNTALVEVPISTFNPVKTVNDLLSIAHRPQL